MALDRKTSERLSILRFPLIVGVVFIHAYSPEVTLGSGVFGVTASGPVSNFIRDFISQGVARIAVPLFFLLSGYFFFLDNIWTFDRNRKKIITRARTLLVPFLFWNILTLSFFFISQKVPALHFYFPERNVPIESFSVFQFCDAIFGIYNPPVSYQFWFIRDLIMLVILTPALYFFLDGIPTISLCGILLMWITDCVPYSMPSPTAITFFYCGAYLAKQNINPFFLDNYSKWLLMLYPIIQVIDACSKGWKYNDYLHNGTIILGMTAVLAVSRILVENEKMKKKLLLLSGCSFFVFAIHEPLLMICRRAVYHALEPHSDTLIIVLYFLIPFLVIRFAMAIHAVVHEKFPKLLSFSTGGR